MKYKEGGGGMGIFAWRAKQGYISSLFLQGEEPVLVYLRNEIIGAALGTTTLRSLGLTTGKGLFR